uniref:Family with sequence similarity 81 member B n=1 Tax=Salarias fasciatus TaxID=181472 RepID=A0A672JP68_SALFA
MAQESNISKSSDDWKFDIVSYFQSMFDCLFPCLRPDDLEHGCSQDVALAVLLDQAFRIREEVAAGLQSKRGSVQVEAVSRKLLESHILTITRIVKQLSSDMQVLEKQITQRDSVTSLTTAAVQNLDQKSMASIGDLRGRVARYTQSEVKRSLSIAEQKDQGIGIIQMKNGRLNMQCCFMNMWSRCRALRERDDLNS